MSRNRDVFQVLVTAGNQAIATQGTALDALLPGQLGIFSYTDNLAVDGAPVGDANTFYLAVGVGTGVILSDILKSSAEFISRQNIVGYSGRCYTPEQPKIIELTNIRVQCDTEYGVKFTFRNQQAYRLNGYNAVSKSFVVKSDCCDDCKAGCDSGNCGTMVLRLMEEINADPEKLILAEMITTNGEIEVTGAPTADGDVTVTLGTEAAITIAVLNADTTAGVATKVADAINLVAGTAYRAVATGAIVNLYGPAGTVTFSGGATGTTATTSPTATAVVGVDDAAALAFVTANPSVCPGLRFTAAASTIAAYCDINLNYFEPRATDIIASLVMGFDCAGTLTTTQEIIYEEGAGYDVKHLEYIAGGWNGHPGPYRVSNLMGVARAGFISNVSSTGTYVTIYLNYNNQSIGGWQHYTNHNATIVVIPTADAVTLDTFTDAMDLIVAGNLKPLNAYLTDCPAITVANTSTSEGDNFQDATPGEY